MTEAPTSATDKAKDVEGKVCYLAFCHKPAVHQHAGMYACQHHVYTCEHPDCGKKTLQTFGSYVNFYDEGEYVTQYWCKEHADEIHFCDGQEHYVTEEFWSKGSYGVCPDCLSGGYYEDDSSPDQRKEFTTSPTLLNELKAAIDKSPTHDEPKVAKNVWEVDTSLRPTELMADYYMCEAMLARVMNPAGRTTDNGELIAVLMCVQEEMDRVCAAASSVFRYLVMICGGEVRYHTAFPYRYSRGGQWTGFKALYDKYGVALLAEVADMFREFKPDTSFGGEKWAQIADVGVAYATGKLNDAMFMDRCFNLQHNGGTMFNKIAWGDAKTHWSRHHDRLSDMQTIGTAHAADVTDWSTLYMYSTRPVAQLSIEYWKLQNEERRLVGLAPTRFLDAERRPLRVEGAKTRVDRLQAQIDEKKKAMVAAAKKLALQQTLAKKKAMEMASKAVFDVGSVEDLIVQFKTSMDAKAKLTQDLTGIPVLTDF